MKKKKVSLDIFNESVLPALQTKHADDSAAIQKAIDDTYEVVETAEDGTETIVAFQVAKSAAPAKDDTADIQAKIDKALADREKANRKPNPNITVGDDKRTEDPKRGFKLFGEFAQSVYLAGSPGQKMDERLTVIKSAQSKAVSGMSFAAGPDGGFLVPPAFSREIWDGMNLEANNLLSMTDGYTLETGYDSLTIPANAETSRANGSRAGGLQAYWRAEAAQMTSSKPTFREIRLEPHELYVFAYVTDKLLRQASSLTGYLGRKVAEEFAFKFGDGIINGTGAGQFQGLLNAACLVSVSKETGQAAATVVKENIDKMYSRLHPNARSRAKWLINIDVEPALQSLNMAVGTGGLPVYLPPGGLADAPNARLKGLPVIVTEFNATLGTVGDIILWDPMGYATVTRSEGVISDTSIHLRFDYGETAFRFTVEAGGQPWLASAITPFKGSNTLSNIVALATRA